MIAVLLAFACSTGSAPGGSTAKATPSNAELLGWVAGQRFHNDRIVLSFGEAGEVSMAWGRMKGEPVSGTVTSIDSGIQIDWVEAQNTLNQVYRLSATDACTLSLDYQKRRVGGEITEPVLYYSTAEGCPAAPMPLPDTTPAVPAEKPADAPEKQVGPAESGAE